MLQSTGVKGKNVEDKFGPVETRIRERLVEDQPAWKCLYACVVGLAREIDKLTPQQQTTKNWSVLERDKEKVFMERFGWDLDRTPAIKRDIETGKVLAHEGDETWDRDLKVAGE